MATRIERSTLPDLPALRRLLSDRVGQIRAGANLVDADLEGPTGVDILIADEGGRPILVDVVLERPNEIPALVFEHLDWFEQNRKLFLKAYAADGVVGSGEPGFVFIARSFPSGVLRAIGAMEGIDARLVRAEYVLVDGAGDVLLEDVTPARRSEEAPAVIRTSGGVGGGSELEPTREAESAGEPELTRELEPEPVTAGEAELAREPEPTPALTREPAPTPVLTREPEPTSAPTPKPDHAREVEPAAAIESNAVRTLLALFKSGVDGLDSGIAERQVDGGLVFELGREPLARVTLSPGSFTVTPGERAENPIVVSDRVSLERALNAVVSLYVREEFGSGDEDDTRAVDVKLTDEERAELGRIWEATVPSGDAR